MKYKLEQTEYIKGIFEKEGTPFKKIEKVKSKVSGDIELGFLEERDTNETKMLALKLTLYIEASDENTNEKIAKMETKHVLYYSLESKEILYDIREGNDIEKYKEDIFEMINTGYLGIKEFIENTFLKSQINIELPYTIAE